MNGPHPTEVLIVGGGPVGLTLSGLLAREGVTSTVVERRTETLTAPAAHVLRNVPRAILGLLGIDDEIDKATPPLPMHFVTWCTTLTGSELGRIDLRSSDPHTPRPWTNLSQNLLEPILRRVVQSHPASNLITGTTVEDVTVDASGVEAVLVGPDGSRRPISADYLVAADGAGSRTRKALGVEMVGDGPLGQFFMVHVRADLSQWIDHRPGPVLWIMNPEASGTLIVHDVRSSHVFMSMNSGADGEIDTLPDRLAKALGLPIDVEIMSIDTWVPYCQVAETYRVGRALLVGDAAHRFPPTGGLGLNTGIVEAHNLSQKLSRVLVGGEPDAVLDEFEAECRDIAVANAQHSLANAVKHFTVYETLGSCSDLAGLEHRLATMSADDRSALERSISDQLEHFMGEGSFPASAEPFRFLPMSATTSTPNPTRVVA